MILDQVKIKYSTQVTHTRTTVQETVTQTDAEYQHQMQHTTRNTWKGHLKCSTGIRSLSIEIPSSVLQCRVSLHPVNYLFLLLAKL